MSDSKQSRKINRFFAEFIAKLRKWLNKIGSPIRISRRLVRQLLGASKGQRKGAGKAAGFVLPTVTLVTLVVTLLVVTTVARSSERAKSAANSRTEQVFRSAATPIVDRARAKLDALINDAKLPRTTPSELTLDSVITSDGGAYTLPDETRLQLVYNFTDPTNTKIDYTSSQIENREYVSTAWKFPIDTDNNGKFDSYGLYSILFRARPPAVTNRPVAPIESRALPMDETTLTGACVSTGNVTNIASDGGWTSSNNQLRKAFFVYAVTVPITDTTSFPSDATQAALYETYNGITSISAVELQQDRARLPQNNNAVFFEGDLELVNVGNFRLNGRVYTSGSLMVGAIKDSPSPITFYQVSSSGGSTATIPTDTPDPNLFGSCYYQKKNSEIIVAGQVVEGDAVSDVVAGLSNSTSTGKVTVHLFAGAGKPPDSVSGRIKEITDTGNSSSTVSVNSTVATNLSSDIALNEFEYNRRLDKLVDAAVDTVNFSSTASALTAPTTYPVPTTFKAADLAYSPATKRDPISVQEDLVKRIQDEALSSLDEAKIARRAALTAYFRERTRKVSYRDVTFRDFSFATLATADPTTLLTPIAVAGQPNAPELAPPVAWMLPSFANANLGYDIATFDLSAGAGSNTTNGFNGKGGIFATTGVRLLTTTTGGKLNLPATDPEKVAVNNETELGDRVLAGNGLPAKWLQRTVTGGLEFVGDQTKYKISTNTSIFWNDSTTSERYRTTRSIPLNSLGVTDRGGFWEISAALDPSVADPLTPASPADPDISPKTGGLRVVTNAGIYSRRPDDTFLSRFRSGVPDDTTTLTIDESSAPLWNGQPIDNLITPLPIDERNFAQRSCSTAGCVDDGSKNYVVWPDSMPMTSAVSTDTRKGDLQMRASAIYHYKYDAYNAIGLPTDYQEPIACVSSYYDPSTPTTAKNAPVKVIGGASTVTAPWNPDASGRSNNGLVYNVGFTAATVTFSTSIGYDTASGLFYKTSVSTAFSDDARNPKIATNTAESYGDRLAYQANLIFPNGRFVNEPLREVLKKVVATPSATLTLPQQSTLDSNLCALQILNATIGLANTSSTAAALTNLPTGLTLAEIPHGSFRESAFLNGREVKSLNRNESLIEAANGNNARGTTAAQNGLAVVAKNRGDIYDLEIEQRQPLEIRATDIDMDRLRGSKIQGGNNTGVDPEYLLPYSGIIYATREDALEDLSYYDRGASGNPKETPDSKRKNLSSTDFLLDPTRKPSSIRLVNGYRLWRSNLDTTKLPNVDGSAIVSTATYGDKDGPFKWTEATKGEKGLTLVSNLPVYVKAQVDPNGGATPSFNKHTREEFTQLLNEDVSDITKVWDNFYQRHANSPTAKNGTDDKLDPNFACRPGQNTTCTLGDEWRPATILADAITVLSANYRDGYRTDGDYDLRNNANTSTSINWQSQLNPTIADVFDTTKRESRKDSSYVLDRRRTGFFNNNFVTSNPWLNPLNSDRKAGTTSSLWPGFPANDPPDNGNLNSYNANGVTPIQRRIKFEEYGMEMCTKIPMSECTFSDWVKTGAGTTTLPDFNPADGSPTAGKVSSPTGAPRYISDDNFRFARRLSFLRFNDIYQDGNQQMIFAGSCTGIPPVFWPMPIGVKNGNNATTGYTYPQVLGSLATPFDNTNNYSYANVPCPEKVTIPTVEIGYTDEDQNSNPFTQASRDRFEGRRRDRNTQGSLEYQLRANDDSKVLPPVRWTTNTNPIAANTKNTGDNDVSNAGVNQGINNGVTINQGSVTNRDDNTSGPATTSPAQGNQSNNNAVYRRFNFAVRLNDRNKLAAGESARVKVTLFPRTSTGAFAGDVGDRFPYAQYIFTTDGATTITATGSNYSNGDVVRVVAMNGTLPTGLSAGTNYYVVSASDTKFNLSLTSGGSAIALGSAGTGTLGVQQQAVDVRTTTTSTTTTPTTTTTTTTNTTTVTNTGTSTAIFDTTFKVTDSNRDAAFETITAPGNNFANRQAVRFSGTSISGVTDGTIYYVGDISSSTFKLYTTSALTTLIDINTNSANTGTVSAVTPFAITAFNSNDTITAPNNNFTSGQAVALSSSSIGGVSNNTIYYVGNISGSTFNLYPTSALTTPINVTTTGTTNGGFVALASTTTSTTTATSSVTPITITNSISTDFPITNSISDVLGTVRATGNTFANGQAVRLYGTTIGGVTRDTTTYYVRNVVSGSTFELYTNPTLTTLVNISTSGANTGVVSAYTPVTVSAFNSATETITATGNTFANGQAVRLSGTTIGGVTNNTAIYFIRNVSAGSTFNLYTTAAAALAGGTGGRVNITGTTGASGGAVSAYTPFGVSNSTIAAAGNITATGRTFTNGQAVRLSGTTISGVANNTTYYIGNVSGSTFRLFTDPAQTNRVPINTAGASGGTISLLTEGGIVITAPGNTFVNGQVVQLSGTTIAGLANNTTYYVRNVVSGSTLQLYSDPALTTLVPITAPSAGGGTISAFVTTTTNIATNRITTAVSPTYPVSNSSNSADTITAIGNNFDDGQAVTFSRTSISGITTDITYYVRNVVEGSTLQLYNNSALTSLVLINTDNANTGTISSITPFVISNSSNSADTITASANNFTDGQAIRVSGTTISGLTNGAIYYARNIVSGSTLQLYTDRTLTTLANISTDSANAGSVAVVRGFEITNSDRANNAETITAIGNNFLDGQPVILTGAASGLGATNGTIYYAKNKVVGSTLELYTDLALSSRVNILIDNTNVGTVSAIGLITSSTTSTTTSTTSSTTVLATNATTTTVPIVNTSSSLVPALQADYLSGLYYGGNGSVSGNSDSLIMTNKNGVQTAIPVGGLLPRLLPVGANSAEAVDPENATCPTSPDKLYCSVVSWTGPTNTTTDPDIKILTVLVVRDSNDESQDEEFRLSLDNAKGNILYAEGSPGGFSTSADNRSIRRGRIRTTSPNNRPACDSGFTFTNNDDAFVNATLAPCPTPTPTPVRTATPVPTATPTPSPTPSPTPTPATGPGTSLPGPVFGNIYSPLRMPFSMIMHPAASYPFTHASGDTLFRPFKPPSSGGSAGGRYVWGDDINGDGILDAGERTDIFPNIPPRSGTSGEIPMLPGNFTKALTDGTEQMTNGRPDQVDRTLWYRTAGAENNYVGEGENVSYAANKNLFINNLSFPTIGNGAGQLRTNLNATGSLILPNTPCISLDNGTVDERCTTKSYVFGQNATYTLGTGTVEPASTTLLNLNLPYNPHFPSDNTSARNITSTTKPASTFVVCGGTGSTQNYQAIERPTLPKTDISGGSCAQTANSAGEAIRSFVGTLPTGMGTALTGGTGILSAKLNPGNTIDTFVGVIPSVSGTLTSTATPPVISPVLRATNTYANNKVHVYNVSNLGKLASDIRTLNGTLTFRANCVTVNTTTGVDSPSLCSDPASVRRGPSPVFIMRGAPTESIEFSGLKIVLDGVDPNNIFWVSSRTSSRLDLKTTPATGTPANNNFLLGTGIPNEPRIQEGQRIVVSSGTLPTGINAGVTYYVIEKTGSKFRVSLSLGGPEVNIDGAADIKVSAEPSFIFSGGTPTSPNAITGATTPNIITGNFLGYTSSPTATPDEDNTSVFAVKDKYSSFRGVRFLGLWGDSSKINNETLFVAMTTVDQPALLPVLQFNVPNATTSSNSIPVINLSTDGGINGKPTANTAQWTIRPIKTEVNAYFVAGGTPSRNGVPYTTSSTIDSTGGSVGVPIVGGTGETGGGLQNFVRFLENWESVPVKIAGGFIQNTRSRFATAPFTTAPISSGTSSSGTIDISTIFMNPVQPGTGTTDGKILSGYDIRYVSRTGSQSRIPYYSPPIRLWGYDVGLLTQQPDRFAERFASPIAGANEFFREVNGDDIWVETLLCALEPATITNTNRIGTADPRDYTRRSLRGKDRRRACDTTKYGATTVGDTIPATVYQ